LLDELGFPELTAEQIEFLCQTTEDTVRKYILNQVASKDVNQLDIFVEVEGTKPVNVSVEVELVLTKQAEAIDVEALVKQAVETGQTTAENFLRKIQ